MIIDAHHHLWQRSLPFDYQWLEQPGNEKINRDFLPTDLHGHLKSRDIDYSIFVQTQHNVQETEWALDLAEQHPFMIGVVGWVDLASDDCESMLLTLKRRSKLVGIRHITQDEPEDDFIVSPNILKGLKVLEKHRVPFDLLFYAKHLKHAVTVAATVPNLPLVIDHISKPPVKQQVIEPWATELRAAAEHPNVYCKLSGMITEADWDHWTANDVRPYVETAIDAFGPERCMFGSDWPVSELAGSYQQVFDTLDQVISSLSDNERKQIFGETAKRFYRLSLPPTNSTAAS